MTAERPPLLNDLFRMIVKMIVGGILIIGLVSCGVAAVAGAGASKAAKRAEAKSETLYGDEKSEHAILRVDIVGPILTHKPEGSENPFSFAMGGIAYGYDIKEKLLDAAKDEKIKAVMLFVTTPGGSIVGSQAIHEGVLAVKAAKKPIVAYVDTISASGGVWSTAGADKIFADHGSLIGSVGVNFGNWLYFEDPTAVDNGIFGGGVETRGGVRAKFVGAGLGKDLGNPWRPMTEREDALLQATADEFYQKFLNHVVENRGIDRQRLVEEYGAMIFANDLAKARGYIDDTKTYQETIAYLADKIGAKGDDWKVVAPADDEKSPFEAMFGAAFAPSSEHAALEATRACAELSRAPSVIMADALADLCRR
jgi:protease-4